MGNPFFNRFGNRGGGMMPGPLGNAQNLIKQFNQFNSQFQGDPREQVQQLLNSGQMTQEQFDRFSDMAQPFMQLLNSWQGRFNSK